MKGMDTRSIQKIISGLYIRIIALSITFLSVISLPLLIIALCPQLCDIVIMPIILGWSVAWLIVFLYVLTPYAAAEKQIQAARMLLTDRMRLPLPRQEGSRREAICRSLEKDGYRPMERTYKYPIFEKRRLLRPRQLFILLNIDRADGQAVRAAVQEVIKRLEAVGGGSWRTILCLLAEETEESGRKEAKNCIGMERNLLFPALCDLARDSVYFWNGKLPELLGAEKVQKKVYLHLLHRPWVKPTEIPREDWTTEQRAAADFLQGFQWRTFQREMRQSARECRYILKEMRPGEIRIVDEESGGVLYYRLKRKGIALSYRVEDGKFVFDKEELLWNTGLFREMPPTQKEEIAAAVEKAMTEKALTCCWEIEG